MSANQIRRELDAFVVPLDVAPPSETEVQTAGRLFNEGVDNIFLANMAFIRTFNLPSNHLTTESKPLYADVLLVLAADDQSRLEIVVHDFNRSNRTIVPDRPEPEFSQYDLRIMVTEVRPDQTQGKLLFYSMKKDIGVVTRRNVSDDWSEELRLRRLANPTPDFINMSKQEKDEYYKQQAIKAHSEFENLQLEVQLGLNERPVQPNEVSSLMTLINRAAPVREFDIRAPIVDAPEVKSDVTQTGRRSPERLRKIASTLLRFTRRTR